MVRTIALTLLLTGCTLVAQKTGIIGNRKVCESPEFNGTWMAARSWRYTDRISCKGKGDPHESCKNGIMEIHFPNQQVLMPVPGCLLPKAQKKLEQRAALENSTLKGILEQEE